MPDAVGGAPTLPVITDVFVSEDETPLIDCPLLATKDSILIEFSCTSVADSVLRLLHSKVSTVEDSSGFRYKESWGVVSIVLVISTGSRGVGAYVLDC